MTGEQREGREPESVLLNSVLGNASSVVFKNHCPGDIRRITWVKIDWITAHDLSSPISKTESGNLVGNLYLSVYFNQKGPESLFNAPQQVSIRPRHRRGRGA